MPPIQFSTSSNQIEAVSGDYVQGHVFVLPAGAITRGNDLIIKYSNPMRVDVESAYYNSSPSINAEVHIVSNEQGNYNILSFIYNDDTFTLTFRITDNYTGEEVELFKIIMK